MQYITRQHLLALQACIHVFVRSSNASTLSESYYKATAAVQAVKDYIDFQQPLLTKGNQEY